MFLKKLLKLRKTLALRLTFWYAAIFTISSFIAFYVFYFLIQSFIEERVDRSLQHKLTEYSALFAARGVEALKTSLDLEVQARGEDRIFFRLLGLGGEEISASNMAHWGGLVFGSGQLSLDAMRSGIDHFYETVAIPDEKVRVRIIYGRIGSGSVLQIGKSLTENEQFLEAFRRMFGASVSALMLFAALIGWFMARRALLGVEEVTHTAEYITSGDVMKRVQIKGRGEEIERLATTFNAMLDRICSCVHGMQEMTDNIAHDLRSPITKIRGIAEMTLTTAKSTEEYETMAVNTIEECDHLLAMINTMLDISEVEAGVGRFTMAKQDLSAVVLEACEIFQPIAEEKNITFTASAPAGLPVNGDIQKLQRVVANLLDNALKYTAAGGTVTVTGKKQDNKVFISVSDTGIGIPEEDLPFIFKRFFRCDQSRSQPGIGLGLSLAQAIVQAHGGQITVTSQPGQGSTFTLILPCLS